MLCFGQVPQLASEALTPDVLAEVDAARELLLLHADPSVADVTALQALRPLPLRPLSLQLVDAAVRRRHGTDLTELSAAMVGVTLRAEPPGAGSLLVAGGADTLVTALRRTLGAQVRTDTVVTAVSQTAAGVTVRHSRGQDVADHVVLAVPAAVAATMDLGLPEVTATLAAITGSRETRVLMVYEAPSWRAAGLSGTMRSDEAIGATYDPTPPEREEGVGLLVADAVGAAAGRLRSLVGEAGGVKRAIDRCLPVEPLSPGRAAVTVSWDDEPWALGGRPVVPAGSWHTAAVLRQPHGRIHLAGDHTAEMAPGSMEGAVESGRRAASQITG